MISAVNNSAILEALKSFQADFEKLSSGSRLNRASDGAAEIAISNELKGEISSLEQDIRNVRDGISMLQTSDGSLDIIAKNILRMKELAVQAASDMYSPAQKRMIQQEFDQLAAQNVQIGEMTKFNGIRLHQNNQTISITAEGQTAASIQSQSIPLVSSDLNNTDYTFSVLQQFLEYVTSYRSELGRHINTLENTSSYLDRKAEEILQSESRIADTDMAAAATSLTSAKILSEANAEIAHSKTIFQIARILL